MKKRTISGLLAMALTCSVFAGAGGNDTLLAEAKSSSDGVETIKIYVPTSGAYDDMDAVLEQVNEISREKIGVEIEIYAFEYGQWFQQYSLFTSGTEDIDIIANYNGFTSLVSSGAAYDLTELLQEYGQDIIEQEGDFLKSGQVDGIQYAIPIYTSYSSTFGIIYRKDIVEELGLEDQVAAVETLEDWGEILAAVKEAKPEMTPFVTNSGNTASNFTYGPWDKLGNDYGVLMNNGETSVLENLFETDTYAEMCSILHDWYLNGYSSKDIETQTDTFAILAQNDAAFSTLGQANFDSEYYWTTLCGKDMGVIFLDEPVAKTYTNVTYSIMSNSSHAEAAMKFLNLWFSDEEVGTLISYGIEGTHYVLNEDGMGEYPEGLDSTTCGYHLGCNISNINRILWNTEMPDYATLLTESNETSKKSAGLGFTFDPTPVANEITALDNVCSKYQIGLESGASDPETVLPEFIEALQAAGIEKVIAEKQSQLDAFLAS